jgi:hypothetical protein
MFILFIAFSAGILSSTTATSDTLPVDFSLDQRIPTGSSMQQSSLRPVSPRTSPRRGRVDKPLPPIQKGRDSKAQLVSFQQPVSYQAIGMLTRRKLSLQPPSELGIPGVTQQQPSRIGTRSKSKTAGEVGYTSGHSRQAKVVVS